MYILLRRDCGGDRHDDRGGEAGKDLSIISPVAPLCLVVALGINFRCGAEM